MWDSSCLASLDTYQALSCPALPCPALPCPALPCPCGLHTSVYMVDHVLPAVSVSSILFLQMSAASAALPLSCFYIAIADMPCCDML